MHRAYAKGDIALAKKQVAELGLADARRILQHGLEHGLQFAGRTADDAQHLRRRRLLLQRLAQLVGANLDLLFQVGIGFLQAAGHVVELIGERLELVAGLDRDALAKVAAADPGRAGAQGLDRHHHSAGEEQAREKRQDETRQQQQARAPDRGVERRVGLADRKVDEQQPSERRDRGVSGEHPQPLDVTGFLNLLIRRAGFAAARGLHLGKARQVGIAQHQADVGMGDQAAVRIDDVGMSALADLDLRNHVPDQLEVDLRDAHAGVAARAGQCQRHVGLGFAAEIDRAVIDLSWRRPR